MDKPADRQAASEREWKTRHLSTSYLGGEATKRQVHCKKSAGCFEDAQLHDANEKRDCGNYIDTWNTQVAEYPNRRSQRSTRQPDRYTVYSPVLYNPLYNPLQGIWKETRHPPKPRLRSSVLKNSSLQRVRKGHRSPFGTAPTL